MSRFFGWWGLLSPIAQNAMDAVIDAMRDKVQPVPGSVVYTDLALGYIEHSGIYVGNGQIANVTRAGDVTLVSPEAFMEGTTGWHIYVSCRNGKAVGSENVSGRAMQQAAGHIKYDWFLRNCHCFTSECITGDARDSEQLASVNPMANLDCTLTGVKWRAKVLLNTNEWRYWDL